MKLEQARFAFLPYLVTRKRVRIRGIEFRSNHDIADMPEDVQSHVKTLSEMFFADNVFRIEEMTFAFFEISSDSIEAEKLLRRLDEAHLLIGYLYASPHPSGGSFLPSETCSLFLFRIGEQYGPEGKVISSLVWHKLDDSNRVTNIDGKVIPTDDLVPGYFGTRNRTVPIWATNGFRIYPELPNIILNLNQDLSWNLQSSLSQAHQWAIAHLYQSDEEFRDETRHRIFASLEWYMKSCRESIEETEALVNLAIALESLLRLRSGEGVTDRFKDAVLTLLGPVPRLDTWLDQFYAARSKAVHEGIASDLNFYPFEKDLHKKKSSKCEEPFAHRSLLSYGRRIFRLCLAGVFAGVMQARIAGLDALFVPNKERIEIICRKLNSQSPPAQRLFSIAEDVIELCAQSFYLCDPDIVSVKSAVGAAKLALENYTNACPHDVLVTGGDIVKLLSSMGGDPSLALLEQMDGIVRQFRSAYGVNSHSEHAALIQTMISLLEYASKAKFKLQCYGRQNPQPPPKAAGAT